MVVHPAAGNLNGTLVNALLYHCKDLSGIGGELRPGIVHRLDKGTSGVMIAAKNDYAHQNLSDQFKSRSVEKRYYALLFGKLPKESGVINVPIGRHVSNRKKMSTKTSRGRMAETYYTVIDRTGAELTFVDIRLATGRTHQIRVHFSHIGHPLIGDDLYGGKAIKLLKNSKLIEIVKVLSRPFLHAYRLVINHPRTGKKMSFAAKLPADLLEVLDGIHKIEAA
jgi:23S rRNA pseudouridine1911/1915/1917 synthase